MTTKEDMDRLFPTSRQEGGNHYSRHKIQPYTFITANSLSRAKETLYIMNHDYDYQYNIGEEII
jgi:hypothetical protein